MRTALLLAVVAGLILPDLLWGQAGGARLPADPEIREAYLAWDRGDYHLALRRYLRVLESADADAVLEIAGLTGEIHPVRELAVDGSGVTVGPEGRFGAFLTLDTKGIITRL